VDLAETPPRAVDLRKQRQGVLNRFHVVGQGANTAGQGTALGFITLAPELEQMVLALGGVCGAHTFAQRLVVRKRLLPREGKTVNV
jgi:hypothetical protein